MSVYKRTDKWSSTWHYRKRVKLPDGRSVRVAGTPSINTKAAAEAAERAHVERLLNPPKPVKERRLMSDVFKRFVDEYTTIANNKDSEKAAKQSAIDCHLEPLIGELYLDQVDDEAIAKLTAALRTRPKARGEGTLSAKACKNILQTLRKCLRWAKRLRWVDDIPEIQMPRVDEAEIRFLEDEELTALLEATKAEPLWHAAVRLAADAGLRQGELRALRWTDLNLASSPPRIVVSRSRWRNLEGSPKSRKPRHVPITKALLAALTAIKATKLRGPYVLSRRDGKPFGAEYMNETIDRLTRIAKLAGCTWHTLRHTFCTRLAMRGADPKTIQTLAGHANLQTTMRYMHVVQGATDRAIALLDEPARARDGHGTSEDADIDSETGDVIQLSMVTPKGLES